MKRRFLPALLSGLLLTLGLAQGDGENAHLLFRVGTYRQAFENGIPPESLGTYVVISRMYDPETSGPALPSELTLRDPDGEVLFLADTPITPSPGSSGLFLGLPDPPKAGTYTLTYEVEGVAQLVTAELEPDPALPAAENLTVRYQDGVLSATWDAVTGAKAYELVIEESGPERRQLARLSVPSGQTNITAPNLALKPGSSYLALLFAYDFDLDPLDPAALAQPDAQPDVSVTSRIFKP